MPVLSRSNKVSRVARTGGSSRRKGESPLGFYALLAVLVILGVSGVVFSRNERLSVTTPNNTPPVEPVANSSTGAVTRAGDRWYEAYGIYVCDKFAPVINSEQDPHGLSTKNDGVIYIHPYQKSDAGKNATIGRFLSDVGVDFTNTSIKAPGGDTVYTAGKTKCGDKDAELVVREWSDVTKPNDGKIIQGNPRDVRVRNNSAVTIAFVPVGTKDIPLPDSATNGSLSGAKDKDAAAQAASTATTVAGGDTTATTVAGTTETTAAPVTTAAP